MLAQPYHMSSIADTVQEMIDTTKDQAAWLSAGQSPTDAHGAKAKDALRFDLWLAD